MEKKIKIIFFFIIFFLNINYLNSLENNVNNIKQSIIRCSSLDYSKSYILHPKNFSSVKIDLKFNSLKEWRKKNFKLLINSEKNKKISGNFRKFRTDKKITETKGQIILHIGDNDKCFIKAKIRVHGDTYSHFDNILGSVKVKLLDGQFFGMTEFILFTPKARGNDNELFAATLFKSLGFLSPRTANVELNFYNKKINYILQEAINKEFIENNNLREFPIYSGDERFTFFDYDLPKSHFSHYRLENKAFIKEHEPSLDISQIGLSILNKLNLHDQGEFYPEYNDLSYLSKNLLGKNIFFQYKEYVSLMLAMNSNHFSRDDLRLYFNRENNFFYPIYYDGNINLHSSNTFINQDCKIAFNCAISQSALDGSNSALKLLKNLNIQDFKNRLKKLNLNNDSLKLKDKIINIDNDIENIINLITQNLIKINNISKNQSSARILKNNIIENLNPQVLIEENKRIKNSNLRKLIYYKKDFKSLTECDIFNSNCENINYSFNDLKEFVSQEYSRKQDDENKIQYTFTSRSLPEGKKFSWFHENFKKENEDFKLINLNDFSFYVAGQIKYNFDNNLRILKIDLLSSKSKIIFQNQNLDKLKIEINTMYKLKENKKFSPGIDVYGFTGCLNIYDSFIDDLELIIEGTYCEDAVNFVRSKGTVKFLNITNTSFDALDSDFSNIIFNSISISNSGNDCVDFSYGIYEIKKSILQACGDKGISVGELSTVFVDYTKIDKADSGIVSKDYASVKIKNSNITNSNICYQTYKKKQEFAGGYMSVNSSNCDNSNKKKFKKDDVSFIDIF